MPFSRSRSFESIARSSMCSCEPNEPVWRSIASTRVVLPWSTCATIATLRRSGRRARAMRGILARVGRRPDAGLTPVYRAQPERRPSTRRRDAASGSSVGATPAAASSAARASRRTRCSAGIGHRHRRDEALRVRILRAAQDLLASCPARRCLPWCITAMRSARMSTTARSWLMNRHANCSSLLEVLQQLEDASPAPRRRAPRSARRRRAARARARVRGRCRRADADRRTARAGSGCGTTRGSSTCVEQLLDALVEVLALRLARRAGSARRSTGRSAGAGSATTPGPGTRCRRPCGGSRSSPSAVGLRDVVADDVQLALGDRERGRSRRGRSSSCPSRTRRRGPTTSPG